MTGLHAELPVERIVADHLENKCISLNDALNELNLDEKLAENTSFCMQGLTLFPIWFRKT